MNIDKFSIKDLYQEAVYWHGTGRYKYASDGTILDVLDGIAKEGGLILHDDEWDWKLGKVKSISLAKSRMYAKLYALMYMFGGQRLTNEYLPLWAWFHYFFGTARILAFFNVSLWKLLQGNYSQRRSEWASKVTKSKVPDIYTIFDKGSDIAGNYPILIGVKRGAIIPLPGSAIFKLHEIRSGSPIGLDGITHIEVPRNHIEETKMILKEVNLAVPVIPIEEGEYYCRKISLFRLVAGS